MYFYHCLFVSFVQWVSLLLFWGCLPAGKTAGDDHFHAGKMVFHVFIDFVVLAREVVQDVFDYQRVFVSVFALLAEFSLELLRRLPLVDTLKIQQMFDFPRIGLFVIRLCCLLLSLLAVKSEGVVLQFPADKLFHFWVDGNGTWLRLCCDLGGFEGFV